MRSVGIYIGTHPETVQAFNDSIMDILRIQGVSEETRQVALKVLSKGVKSPNYNTIQNCHAHMEEKSDESDEIPEDGPDEYPEDDDEEFDLRA